MYFDVPIWRQHTWINYIDVNRWIINFVCYTGYTSLFTIKGMDFRINSRLNMLDCTIKDVGLISNILWKSNLTIGNHLFLKRNINAPMDRSLNLTDVLFEIQSPADVSTIGFSALWIHLEIRYHSLILILPCEVSPGSPQKSFRKMCQKWMQISRREHDMTYT